MTELIRNLKGQIRAVRALVLYGLHESRRRQGARLLARDLRHLIDRRETAPSDIHPAETGSVR